MTKEGLLTRRNLLKGTAAAGALVAAGCTVSVNQEEPALADSEGAETGAANEQFGFLVDVSKCVGCKNCIKACREGNALPDTYADRRWLEEAKDKAGKTRLLSHSCMHCENPACMAVCPAGAISKDNAGSVLVNKDRCIGCKYCYQACPFGVPHYNEDGMDKCDTCRASGVAAGDTPNCVKACKFGALKYGAVSAIKEVSGVEEIDAPGHPSYYLKYPISYARVDE